MATKKRKKEPIKKYDLLPMFSLREIRPTKPGEVPYLQCQICGEDMLMGVHADIFSTYFTDEKGNMLPEPDEVLESITMCRGCYKKYESAIENLTGMMLDDVAFDGVL